MSPSKFYHGPIEAIGGGLSSLARMLFQFYHRPIEARYAENVRRSLLPFQFYHRPIEANDQRLARAVSMCRLL
jgi:hypothetical protein